MCFSEYQEYGQCSINSTYIYAHTCAQTVCVLTAFLMVLEDNYTVLICLFALEAFWKCMASLFFSVHVSLITWWGFWQGRSMLSSLSLGSDFVTLEVWPLTRVIEPCSQVYVLLMRSLGNSLSSVSYNVPWKVWIWGLNCLLSLGLVTIKYVCISWAPAVCWLWFWLLRRVGEKDDSCPEETHIRAGITWKGN